MIYKHWILSALLLIAGKPAAQNLVIAKQGQFTVGGETLQREGTYDNSKFVGWATQEETGQSYRGDHAFVEFQLPAEGHALPLVYVHGYGGSGVCWQMTPDGREGFSTLMLRRGWGSYVVDMPGRGRAGRTTATNQVKPVADEMFWFDIWRMGIWPRFHEDVQFPRDSASLSQFFRELTPDLSDHRHDLPALSALADRIGDHVLVTHSAGGITGWFAAIQNPQVKAVASYEPGGFLFPEGEVPARIDGLTGGVAGTPVPMEQYKRLTQIPIVLYFGDYIPESIKDQVYAAMENDNKSFQLALYELDPESISSISEMAYKADISLTEISGLLSGKEVESVSCTMAEHVSGKNTYYRVTYSHNLRENLKLSDLY